MIIGPALTVTAPVDLGTEEPAQVHLQSYPTRVVNGQKHLTAVGLMKESGWNIQ